VPRNNVVDDVCETDNTFTVSNKSTLSDDTCITFDIVPTSTDIASDLYVKLEHLTMTQQIDVHALLHLFADIFGNTPGKTEICQHKIVLKPGTQPIKCAPYRVNPTKFEVIKTEINDMLKLGVIEPSDSPWASPVVLVPKLMILCVSVVITGN
jgi:hypothetical protein